MTSHSNHRKWWTSTGRRSLRKITSGYFTFRGRHFYRYIAGFRIPVEGFDKLADQSIAIFEVY